MVNDYQEKFTTKKNEDVQNLTASAENKRKYQIDLNVSQQ